MVIYQFQDQERFDKLKISWFESLNYKLFREYLKADENKYISELINESIWLGLTDRRTEGTWQSIDDWTVISYANWAPGEPNDYGVREDHAVMKPDGQWNDNKGKKKIFCAIPSEFFLFSS